MKNIQDALGPDATDEENTDYLAALLRPEQVPGSLVLTEGV